MSRTAGVPPLRRLRFAHAGPEHPAVALGDNLLHAFAAEHALCLYRREAVGTWIPKNACTTLRYSAALDNGVIKGPDEIGFVHVNNSTFMPDLKGLLTARYTFAMLRDPFSRLASAYLDKIVALSPNAHAMRRQISGAKALRNWSFRDFVDAIGATAPLLDEHWRPQQSFLVYRQYDAWFCVEDMAKAREILAEKIGFEIADARGLDGPTLAVDEELDIGPDTPGAEIADIKASGRRPHGKALYDKALIARVSDLYANDLSLYRRRTGRSCWFDD